MTTLRTTALALAALAGSAAMAGEAAAMPANGPVAPTQQIGGTVEQVRWVCGPYRCWWRPGPYWGGWGGPSYAYYGGGPYWPWGWGGWGWHRHWW